jgi:hypothetical protein
MPLTYEQRVESLKKAREIKKMKADERAKAKEPTPEPEPILKSEAKEPIKEPKKKPLEKERKKDTKSLDLTELPPIKTDNIKVEETGDLVEETVEVKKIKKPKRIVKKIIQEVYDSDETEEEEIIEVIKLSETKKPPVIQTKHKPKKEQPPKTIQIKDISTTLFNY